jgi:hypothetical protein
MGQPACERADCERVGGWPIKNCKPLPSKFRESFADATVERVVIDDRKAESAPIVATVQFSNGASVKFKGPHGWYVSRGWAKEITRRNFEPAESEATAGSGGEAASPPPIPAGANGWALLDADEIEHRREQGVAFSFRVPTVGWERFSSISTDESAGGPISINKSVAGPQGAEVIIFWTSFPYGDYADPCAGLLSPSVGPSAADLAAAVSTAPGTELVTGPANVTVGGRPAKYVALTVGYDVGCDPGFFYTWRDVYGGALWPKTRVGDTIMVWIVDVQGTPVDVHGTRLFIEAETKGLSRDLEHEVQQIVESIRFE